MSQCVRLPRSAGLGEGTGTSPATAMDGYDVIVTGIDGEPEVFKDFSDPPFARGRKSKVINSKGLTSNASGRYQQMLKDWPHYRALLKLPDFSPISQDLLALQHIRECRALPDVHAGRIETEVPGYLGQSTGGRLWAARAPHRGLDQAVPPGWWGVVVSVMGLKVVLAGTIALVLLTIGATWKVQDWRYGKQLASQAAILAQDTAKAERSAREEERRRYSASEKVRNDAREQNRTGPPLVMLSLLMLLATGCTSQQLSSPPDPAAAPPILPLPSEARQPPAPPWCSPSCSAGLTGERESWRRLMIEPE
jgi:hypothetical protein